MELNTDEPGMIRQFHNLHQLAVGGQPRQHHAVGLNFLPIGVVELKAVAVALGNLRRAVQRMANATPALQAAAAATDSIPILGTSVTDYASALSISNWTGATGTNISGTSDLAPLDGQAAMMNEGRIILDIEGEEKKKLTKADLLQKFAEVAGVQEETDEVLLS